MWNDFETKEFVFGERNAVIIYPKCEPNGRMLLKTEYLDAFPDFDIAMLKKGYHLIHIFHRNRWAPDEEIEIMAGFVRYCAEELNLSKRCVLEGMSAGGMQAMRFAELYPELSAVLYLDAPVMNVLSVLGYGECRDDYREKRWREMVAAFGFSRSSVINFRKNPIDNMEPLLTYNIPVIMLYGNADNTVIYEENGKVLEEYYKKNGGTICVIQKSMCAHHPHGLDDPMILVDFVEKHYNECKTNNER